MCRALSIAQSHLGKNIGVRSLFGCTWLYLVMEAYDRQGRKCATLFTQGEGRWGEHYKTLLQEVHARSLNIQKNREGTRNMTMNLFPRQFINIP